MIKFNWDNANADMTTAASVKEVHDFCNVVGAEKHTGRTNKTSIKLTFATADNCKFNAFMGIADKAGEITVQRLTKLLVKSVGEEDAKRIFEKVANDEDVNNDTDFILEFTAKVNRKLEASPVKVYVDREKSGENWNVKWYFEKPQKETAADVVAAANKGIIV